MTALAPRPAPAAPTTFPARLAPRGPFRVVTRAPAELGPLVPAWRELAASSSVQNPFFEPFMLLPAIEHLRDGADVEVAVVVDEGGRLIALAPFERRARWRGLPMPARVLWAFRHGYLGTPLVRAGHERPAMAALLDWAAGAAPLLELRNLAAAGEVHRVLIELIHQRGLEAGLGGRHTRALFVPGADAESYLERALSSGKRKELRRQERRLAELGELSRTWIDAHEDPGRAIHELLALEVAGWKGDEGGAMACDPGDRCFFERVCRAAHAEGRLLMSALRVAGRPVAAKCSFLCRPGAFAFKIAYDETLARYSPGVLLEIDNIRRLHGRRDVEWMDSCAAPGHPMIDHLWPDRLAIETLLVAPGGGGAASALVASTPLLRRVTHGLRRFLRRKIP